MPPAASNGSAPLPPAARLTQSEAPLDPKNVRTRSFSHDITRERPLQMVGLPLRHRRRGGPLDPSLAHPAYDFNSDAGAGVGAASKGPRRMQRRAVAGIGGAGVSPEMKREIRQRRDVIVGKFSSAHQASLDDEILELLRED